MNKSSNSITKDLSNSLLSVLKIGLLVLLFIPFSFQNEPSTTIKLYLLSFLGLTSIAHLLLSRSWQKYFVKPNWYFSGGLFVFLILSGLTFWLTYSPTNSLFGGEGYRLGYLALISSIAIGLSARQIINPRSIMGYYFGSLAMLIIGILGSYLIYHTSGRLAWPIFLSNNLALLLGAGFLVGIYLLRRVNHWIIGFSQLAILAGIFLTQSRLVLLAIILIGGIYFYRQNGVRLRGITSKNKMLFVMVALVLTICYLWFAPVRLKSVPYLKTSIIYRIELYQRGLEMILIKPLTGIGPDAIVHYFNHGVSYGAELTKTLKGGYKFISVHSVYLDKFIEYGLVAGVLFCYFVIHAIRQGFKEMNDPDSTAVLMVFILSSLYGLIDFFSIETMVLFWIGLIYLSISGLTEDGIQ